MFRSRLVRRLSAAGFATAMLTAGITATFVESAGATIRDVTPQFGFNNAVVEVRFTPDQSFLGAASPLVRTNSVFLTRQGGPIPPSACQSPPSPPNTCGATQNRINGSLVLEQDPINGRDPSDNTFFATFNLAVGGGDATGPANPGIYDLTMEETQANGLGGTTRVSDSCSACFTVVAAADLSVTNLSIPNVRPGTVTTPYRIKGTGFTRGTGVEVLFGGAPDPTVRVFNQDTVLDANGNPVDPNPDTATEMSKELDARADAPGGDRDLRLFNTDGSSTLCVKCLSIDSLFVDSVNPLAVDNRGVKRIAITGRRIQAGAQVSLVRSPAVEGQPDIQGTDLILTDNGTIQTISATFDMTGAAPGDRGYLIKVTNPDGGSGTCPGTCRLSVAGGVPTVTAAEPPSAPAGTDDGAQAIIGTNLARGLTITFSNAAVTIAPGSIKWVALTRVEFLVDVASNAAPGKSDIKITNTDGKTATCVGCFEITAAPASPEPSPEPSPSVSESASPPPPAEDFGLYTPVNPRRILDTRDGTGGVRSPLAPGESRSFPVTGQAGVPADASAVVFNLTAITPSSSGFVTAFPTGSQRPNASNINFVRGDVIANLVKVRVGSNGRVSLFNNSGTTNVAADVVGYYSRGTGGSTPTASATPSDTASASASGSAAPSASGSAVPSASGSAAPSASGSAAPSVEPSASASAEPSASAAPSASDGSRYTAINPQRILDTRDGNGGSNRPIGPGESRVFQVTNRATVPANATAVVFNMTAVTPTASGFLTAFPTGTTRPVASNINFVRGDVIANLVIVRVGDNGRVSIYNNSGETHAAADIVGYYSPSTAAASYTSVQPQRILDTRDGSNSPARPIGPGESRSFRVTNLGGVPSNASAVVFNLTAITPTNSGFLTAYPAGSSRPLASNINFTRGEVIANLVIVRVGNQGQVTLFNNSGSTHAAADVVGWFGAFDPSAQPTATPSPTASGTPTATSTPTATATPTASTTATAVPSASASTTAAPSASASATRTPATIPAAGATSASGGPGSTAGTLGGLLLFGLVTAAAGGRSAPRYARRH